MSSHPAPRDQLFTWSNHYSPKYEKCFIEIRRMLRIIGPNPKHTDAIYTGEVSWLGTELEDAFEQSKLAWSSSLDNQCLIEGDSAPCPKTRNYITEHMTN